MHKVQGLDATLASWLDLNAAVMTWPLDSLVFQLIVPLYANYIGGVLNSKDDRTGLTCQYSIARPECSDRRRPHI